MSVVPFWGVMWMLGNFTVMAGNFSVKRATSPAACRTTGCVREEDQSLQSGERANTPLQKKSVVKGVGGNESYGIIVLEGIK